MNSRTLYSLGILLLFICLPMVTEAQTISQPIITWQAHNFYPSDYRGKALPSPGTKITLSVATIRGGKFLDLGNTKVRWYLDGKLMVNASSPKTSFTANKVAGDSHFVRVTLELASGNLENSIRIPVIKPLVVVPMPKKTVSQNSTLRLRALPYFFNIQSINNLRFSWKAGGEEVSSVNGNELRLNIGTPQNESQRNLLLSVIGQNISNEFEAAEEILRLKIN